MQPTNDVTGDDGNGSPVLTATTTEIPTSEAVGGKKRSREATCSTPKASLPTRSKKRAKLPHSRVHATSEEAGIAAELRAVRRSLKRATIKAREGSFEGARGGSEVPIEETDDNFMPIYEDDEQPLDYDDADHDEDGRQGIVAKIGQQGRSAIKSFDERFMALMGFKQKFGHCNVQRKKSGEYQSLGQWCNSLRKAYKKIQNSEIPDRKLTQEMIHQLDDAGFNWSVSTCRTFEERYAELMKYKLKVGHCNVPQTKKKSGEYQSLGVWCNNLRMAYKKIQNSETPHIKLTQEQIRKLEDAGFKWRLVGPIA